MDERIAWIVAAIVAELGSSILFYRCVPGSSFTAASPNLLSYAVEHGFLAAGLWVLFLVGAWFTAGPQLIRLRQNLSSKVVVLVRFGSIGTIISGIASSYQFTKARDEFGVNGTPGPIALGLLVQAVIYVGIFAGTVLVAYLIGRSRKPTVTPPPRFGRE